MEERRAYTRRMVKARVKLEHAMFGTIEAGTVDISDGGVFVGLDMSPPVNVGDDIRLSFLDSAQPEAVFNARLVRITDRGWGLSFIDYEVDGVRRKIDDLRQEFRAKHTSS